MNDLNVLALFKGSERFIFVFDDASRSEILDTIRDAAANPQVVLNWFDAAVLTERAKQAKSLNANDVDPTDEEVARY